MKKIITTTCLCLSLFAFSQKYYSKISDTKINQERLEISKNFIDTYLNKCKNSDFTKFDQFILSKSLEKFFLNEIEKSCKKSVEMYGKLKVLNFNSAYLNKYTKNFDPLDLYVFDVQSEKLPDIKYISVWVYHDQNVVSGIWISKEKPLGKSKPKDDDKKESAL